MKHRDSTSCFVFMYNLKVQYKTQVRTFLDPPPPSHMKCLNVCSICIMEQYKRWKPGVFRITLIYASNGPIIFSTLSIKMIDDRWIKILKNTKKEKNDIIWI